MLFSLRTWKLTHGDQYFKKAAFSDTLLLTFPELEEESGGGSNTVNSYHLLSRDQVISHKTEPCLQTVSNSSARAGGKALAFFPWLYFETA